MTQLPARKIAACFNNICFWRERKPLQWAAFAHVQSGHTDVTTLLREIQAAEEGVEARVEVTLLLEPYTGWPGIPL